MRRMFPRSRLTLILGTGLCLLFVPVAAVLTTTSAAGSSPTLYEAEDATLTGVTVESSMPGFSGSGYVTGFDESTDEVTFTILDSPGGLHDLTIRYATPYGQKHATLLLNGSGMGEVVLTEVEGWATVAAGRLNLRPGENTVTIRSNWGWYHIDAITVAPSPEPPPHQVTADLANPNASPSTRALMRYLVDHYGRNILSGQQDYESIEWLRGNVGRLPAIAGLDMMDYSPSRVERGATSREVENAIDWDARGGIVTFCWHWNAPTGLIDEPGREWWRGFYTDATTFNVAEALADPTSTEYQLLLRDMDAIAAQLQRLEDADVPVLWRPLHEAEGGWFWWGAHGPEPARQLWRLMFDRFTNYHHLDNLIWVWNSASPEWYPGDDVVDIVSSDHYPPVGDHGPLSGAYQRLVELGGDRKLVALTETGSIPDPDELIAYRADWSWFVTWSGSFIEDGQYNPLDFLQWVYNHPYVITLDELEDFKNWPDTTPSGPPSSPSESPTAEPTDSVPPISGSPSQPVKGCSVTYRIIIQWPGGFHGEVIVTNTGSVPIDGWTVQWAFTDGQTITHIWNATLTSTSPVTVQSVAYNSRLDPSASTTFGFLGTYQGANSVPAVICIAS